MARSLLSLTLAVGLGMSLLSSVAAAQSSTLRWFGHAFFFLTSSQGVRVALDPFGDIGYAVPEAAGGWRCSPSPSRPRPFRPSPRCG